MRIDLNADIGESPERWASGDDLELLAVVTSANVCCGAYAGDEDLMRSTCAAAVKLGVAIGAQVGYPDREGFGRLYMDMPGHDLTDEVARQILLLEEIAQSVGGHVAYVKPHGALYNNIVFDDLQAEAVVNALVGLTWQLPLLGLPGSVSLSIAGACGIPIVEEGFADRAYTVRGTLIPRNEPGAVLTDPEGRSRPGGHFGGARRWIALRAQRQPGRAWSRAGCATGSRNHRCHRDKFRLMRLLPYGDAALLLDCASLDEAQGWYAALHDRCEDAVLGAQSVLLRGKPAHLRQLVAHTSPVERSAQLELPTIEIPVRYDGPDIDEVAELTGLSPGAIASAHTGTLWNVAFGGFAPGFAYLAGGDQRLSVPRRSSPRTRIPAGAVGLAGEFSGIYPRESPGGWQIIGHTDVAVWDVDREPPALLLPGHTVRFVESP